MLYHYFFHNAVHIAIFVTLLIINMQNNKNIPAILQKLLFYGNSFI